MSGHVGHYDWSVACPVLMLMCPLFRRIKLTNNTGFLITDIQLFYLSLFVVFIQSFIQLY